MKFGLILLLFITVQANAQFQQGSGNGGGMMGGGMMGRGMGNSSFGSNDMGSTKKVELTTEERALKITEELQAKLELDPDQAQKVGEINLKYAKKFDVFREKTLAENDPEEIMYKKFKDFRMGENYRKDKEFKLILTEIQYEKLQKIRKRNGEK